MRDLTEAATQASPAEASRLLMIWLSPSFPVGAYAYSHGLETAVARGLVLGRDGLEAWLRALLVHGAVRNDLILLMQTMRATGDGAALAELNMLALALQPSAERHLETAQQGTSFAAAIAAAWPCGAMTALRAAIDGDIAYAIAVGAAAAGHALPAQAACHAYALALVQNLVSAAIRLSVVGQTDGQRVLAAVSPGIASAADAAEHLTLDDLGTATLSADLASLEHETQYSRLFRS
jgi:urease accessory protein